MNIQRLLELVEKALTDPPAVVKDYCRDYYSPYYHLMFLVATEEDGWCVELGVESGRGSNAMFHGAFKSALRRMEPVTGIIGIDNKENSEIKRLPGKPDFNFILGSSLPPPTMIESIGKNISLLHIDTEHTFAQAREEFTAYKPYLIDGAVVLFDDTNACEGEVLKYLMSLPYDKFVDDRLHPSCGYGGIVYEAKHDV